MSLTALPRGAQAQTLPGSVAPGRVVRRDFSGDSKERPDRQQQKIPTPTGKKKGVPQVAPFGLVDVKLTGARSLSPRDLAGAWARYRGRRVGLTALRAISAAIVKRYRRAGYALVSVVVPRQSFAGGVVRMTVVEGYVSEFVIRDAGKRPLLGGRSGFRLLRTYVRRIAAERPLRQATLERYTLLAQDLPGLKVGFAFAPTGKAGQVRMIVTARHTAFNLIAGLNNHGSDTIGPWQYQVGGLVNHTNQYLGQTRFQYAATVNFDELHFGSVSHVMPVGSEGTTVTFSGVIARTHPQLLDLRGRAYGFDVTLLHPFRRRRKLSVYARLGIGMLASRSELLGTTIGSDRLRTAKAGLIVLYRPVAGFNATASVTFTKGLEVLDARADTSFTRNPDFNKVTGRLEARWQPVRALAPDLSLRASVVGQFDIGGAVPTAEKLGYGGRAFGRAYDDSHLIGDRGVLGRAELAYTFRKLLRPVLPAGAQVYTFVDAGHVWNNFGSAGIVGTYASSAGGGVRMRLWRYFGAAVEAAVPIWQGRGLRTNRTRISVSFVARY